MGEGATTPLFGLGGLAAADPPPTLPGSLLALALVVYAARGAPWRAWFGSHPDRLRVWLASLVLLTLLWSMRAPVLPGVSFHFMLATMLTLMHGWRIALVGLAVVALGASVLRGEPGHWSILVLCDALAPVAFVQLWHRLVSRVLPRNYWVFFFVTTFLGSFGACAASVLANTAYGALTYAAPSGLAFGDRLVLLALMGFGEASLNGFVVASATLHRPHWVASIDAERYASNAR